MKNRLSCKMLLMVVSTYQAASGVGAAAMEELELQTREIVDESSETDRRSFTGEEYNTNTPSPQKSAPEQNW
ncbi:hypothetical protein LINPERPRIM_LOCUS1874 [Linum perenne]